MGVKDTVPRFESLPSSGRARAVGHLVRWVSDIKVTSSERVLLGSPVVLASIAGQAACGTLAGAGARSAGWHAAGLEPGFECSGLQPVNSQVNAHGSVVAG